MEPRSAFEKRYVRKDGELLWVNLTAAIIRDENGEVHHYVTMVKDITERKRAEEALHQSKRELEVAATANQSIMDNSLDVICTVDESGRFLTMNAACEQLWGYTASEMIGRKYIDFVHPDDRGRTTQTETNLKSTRKVTDFVNRYIRKDGGVVDVLWSATWSDRAKTFFGVAHDLTERAKNGKSVKGDKKRSRAREQGQKRISFAHEPRVADASKRHTGFSQLVQRQNPTRTQLGRIGYIINAGRHLLGLINEVLDISRIEVGRMQLSLEPVCVADALEETLDLMRPLASQRKIQLTALADVDANVHVLADRQRLKQVLLNLLTNAVKYTPVSGSVSVSYDLSGNNNVRILVTDNGPGIPKDQQKRLFAPFERLGAEQSNVEGTGLGLALCRRLMDAMQGQIELESKVGHGSTFWLELPKTKSPRENISSGAVKHVTGETSNERKPNRTLHRGQPLQSNAD